MDHPAAVILIVATVVIVAAGAAYFYWSKRRSKQLREHFGPEYDRVVGQEKSVRHAEGVLEFREKAREKLEIRPLSRADQVTFANRWATVQREFVDDPQQAVSQADRLVSEVMQVSGYPMASFEQRAEIISVDHPVVVQNYRSAHEIALRQRNQASTEDLRKAMVHYRSLFDELLQEIHTENAATRKEA